MRIRRLCAWFDGHARDLPWRRLPARQRAWGGLTAELLLQQTQASRVAERFGAFLRRFPTPAAMASAPLGDVLALWQGLGYYRRAHHLHAAARMIVHEFDGRVPCRLDDLLKLPGVGRYTAGAIASIVFGQPEPIVDGNVRRVLARWWANEQPPMSPAMIGWTWERAAALVKSAPSPGQFNEALMELGATVCTPGAPRCQACPVASLCIARRKGVQGRIPRPRPAAAPSQAHHHAVIIHRRDRVLLELRPSRGLWAGLWQTPTIEMRHVLTPYRLCKRLQESPPGLAVRSARRIARFEHRLTHRRIVFHVFETDPAARVRRAGRSGLRWWRLDELDRVPLSAPQRRILHHLTMAIEGPAVQSAGKSPVRR